MIFFFLRQMDMEHSKKNHQIAEAVRFRRQLERIQRAMDRCNVLPPSPGKIEERVKINVTYICKAFLNQGSTLKSDEFLQWEV